MKKLIAGILLALLLATTAIPVFAANGQKPLDHVTIYPNPAAIIPGGTQLFTAMSQDSENKPVTGVTYSWDVTNGGGTFIPNSGLFAAGTTTGTYHNTVRVTATKGGITKYAYADVIVATPGVLYSILITPDTATVVPLGTQQYSATVKDAFGNAVVISPTWSVTGAGNAIDVTGKFTAGGTIGTFTVTATAIQGTVTVSDTATAKIANQGDLDKVVISPTEATVVAGNTRSFSVTSKDAYNQVLNSGIIYVWTVTGSGNSVENSGKFTAGTGTGVFTVTVTATQTGTNITKTATAQVSVVTETENNESHKIKGAAHGKKKGWNGGDTPPGWSKGKKNGWKGRNMPPGLAKK